MAANTSTKVATITGAAKDDFIGAAQSGLSEDNLVGNLNVLANDPGAAKLYSLYQPDAAGTTAAQFPTSSLGLTAMGASISINADGTIKYDASALSASLQSLAEGEIFTDTFVYTVRMANGALSTAKVAVELFGVNDAPTLAAVAPVDILDTAADDTPAAVLGTLQGHDVDHGAVLSYGLSGAATQSGSELVATNDYGTLTLDTVTGAYSFLADPDQIDALKAGETVTVSFDALVTDEHAAASATTALSFNIVGTNDIAVISGEAEGAVAEDGVQQAEGVLAVADRDAGESLFAAVDPDALHGVYGDFTFDATSGAWSYQLRNGDANVQALSAADSVADELVVQSLDGSDSETIRVSIAGQDEIVPIAEIPANPVKTYMVNNGLTEINGRKVITGFDSNDLLQHSNNFDFKGISTVDFDQDGTSDSSMAEFSFVNGAGKSVVVDVVLVGYLGLDAAHVIG